MTGIRVIVPKRLSGPLRLLAGGAIIAALDLVDRSRSWGTAVLAVLDEPAHLLTAWLVWAAVSPRRPLPGALPWVLVGAVAIDVDHLPLYMGHTEFLVHGGRPPTHSLITVGVLAVLALVTRRARVFGGLAVGVLLHFLRDLATGPGIPVAWPLVDVSVRVPYVMYAVVVATAVLVAAVRAWCSRPSCGSPPVTGVTPGHLHRVIRAIESWATGHSPGDDGRVDQGFGSRPYRRTSRTDEPDGPGREPA